MSRKNKSYPAELKYQAVADYLSGAGSLRAICKKYKIGNKKRLQDWIKLYNSHKELKCHTWGSRMTKGRDTTYEERIALVHECIKEIRVRKDYEISITLNASFNQVEQLKAVSTYDGAEIFEEISEKGA